MCVIWVFCVLFGCYMGMVLFECYNLFFGCYVCYLGVMRVIWVFYGYGVICYNELFGFYVCYLDVMCVLFGCYMDMALFECYNA